MIFLYNFRSLTGLNYCSLFDFLLDLNHFRVLPTNTMNVSTKNKTDVMSRATIVEPSMSVPSRT